MTKVPLKLLLTTPSFNRPMMCKAYINVSDHHKITTNVPNIKCTHKIHRHPLPQSNGGRDEGSGDPDPLKYDIHNKPLLQIYMFCTNHIFIEYTVTQHHHPLFTVVTIFGLYSGHHQTKHYLDLKKANEISSCSYI